MRAWSQFASSSAASGPEERRENVGARARRPATLASVSLALLALVGCMAHGTPAVRPGHDVWVGLASWYGEPYHGQATASGEVYDMHDLTAAHRNLPFGTRLRVTSMNNGRSVVVEVTDRGPFVPGREIDLSLGAARALSMVQEGVTRVRLERLR